MEPRLLMLLLILWCTASEQCPAPYTVDYTVAKSLSVAMTLLSSEGDVIGDASDALKGSTKHGLEIPVEYRWVTLVFDLDDTSQTCTQWEISAFRLTVLGVNSFIVTIGSQSSRLVQVHLITYLLIICIGGWFVLGSVTRRTPSGWHNKNQYYHNHSTLYISVGLWLIRGLLVVI